MVNSNSQDFYHSRCYFYDLRFVRLTSCNPATEIPELGPKSITQHKKTCCVKVWTFTKACTKNVVCVVYLKAPSVARTVQHQQPTNKCCLCITGPHMKQWRELKHFKF